MRGGIARRRLDLRPRRAQSSEADVLRHRLVEQDRFLRHQCDAAAQRGQSHVVDVLPVDRDAPGLDVVEAQQQVEDRALARARRADQRHLVAGRHRERHAADRRRAAVIGEEDVLERDRPAIRRRLDSQRLGARPVGDLGLLVDDAEDPVRRRNPRRRRRPQLRQVAHRLQRQQQRGQERREMVDADLALLRLVAGIIHRGRDHRAAEQVGRRHRRRARAHHAQQEAQALRQPLIGPRRDVILQAIGLDDALAVERLGERDGQLGRLLHAARGGAAQRRTDHLRHPGDEGHDHHGDQRQPPVLVDHHHGQGDERDQLQPQPRDAADDGIAHQRGVVDEVRDELPRMHRVERAQILMHEGAHHVVLGFGHGALADRVHQRLLDELRDRTHHDDRQDRERDPDQPFGVLLEEQIFDRRIGEPGEQSRHRGGHRHAGHREGQRPPLLAHIVAEQPPHDDEAVARERRGRRQGLAGGHRASSSMAPRRGANGGPGARAAQSGRRIAYM